MIYPRSVRLSPLFSGMEKNELDALLECLGALSLRFERDDFILRAGQPALWVGLVAEGSVRVVREDFFGSRTILAHIGPSELFGEAFAWAGSPPMPVSVVAAEPCAVLLLDCRRMVSTCREACTFHTRLVSNMLGILAGKNILLTRKMEHLSQKTTREKLLSYLVSLAGPDGRVTLPFTRQELAEYLCVDRSALSRELGRMREDGVLEFERNRFVLRRGTDTHT